MPAFSLMMCGSCARAAVKHAQFGAAVLTNPWADGPTAASRSSLRRRWPEPVPEAIVLRLPQSLRDTHHHVLIATWLSCDVPREVGSNESQAVPKAAGKRRADDRAEGGGLSEGEVSDGGASVASSSVSKLARQARNGFDTR